MSVQSSIVQIQRRLSIISHTTAGRILNQLVRIIIPVRIISIILDPLEFFFFFLIFEIGDIFYQSVFTHIVAKRNRLFVLADGTAGDGNLILLIGVRNLCPINAVNLTAEQLNNILQKLLYEFPLREIAVSMPSWVTMLEPGHWLQSSVYQALLELAGSVHKMGDMTRGKPQLNCANTTGVTLTGMDLACGQVQLQVGIEPDIFFKILGEETDLPITDEASLLPCMLELAKAKAAYDKIKSALEQVQATGYGIVMPGIEELHLEEPEIVRQGGQYGVRLSASAPSLHLMRATIHTELSPTVGSEEQGETLIQGLLKDFESDPSKLWSTNIFGKSLNELVNEGLQAKLMHMPAEARTRLQQTLERIINDGCDGLICILL